MSKQKDPAVRIFAALNRRIDRMGEAELARFMRAADAWYTEACRAQSVEPAPSASANTGMAQGAVAQIASEISGAAKAAQNAYIPNLAATLEDWARRLRHA